MGASGTDIQGGSRAVDGDTGTGSRGRREQQAFGVGARRGIKAFFINRPRRGYNVHVLRRVHRTSNRRRQGGAKGRELPGYPRRLPGCRLRHRRKKRHEHGQQRQARPHFERTLRVFPKPAADRARPDGRIHWLHGRFKLRWRCGKGELASDSEHHGGSVLPCAAASVLVRKADEERLALCVCLQAHSAWRQHRSASSAAVPSGKTMAEIRGVLETRLKCSAGRACDRNPSLASLLRGNAAT